mgnify:CR=1 FL=1
MARISAYPFDNNVTDNDALLATEASNGQTKQFTAAAVARYLNIKGKISISAQMVFRFKVVNAVSGDFTGQVDGAAFAGITTLELSTRDVSGQNVVKFMEYLVGNNILISKQNEISTFGHYTLDSYTAKGDFHTLILTNLKGEGALEDEAVYDFAVFTLPSQGAPTFEFDQNLAATTWDITHNLAKFPSITVIDTGNTVVTGEYNYVTNNRVILTFSAAFAGKAYLN